jgi:hypothetical protein
MTPNNAKSSQWGRLLVLCALTLLSFACMSTEEVAPEWEVRQGEGFSFAYPADWNFHEIGAAGEGYVLFMPEREGGTNIVVLRNPQEHEDLAVLEEKMTHALENNAHLTLTEMLGKEEVELAGRDAVQLHYTAVASANQETFEAYQVGTLLPNDQAVVVTLGIFAAQDRESAREVFDTLLDSVEITE